jgi:hypothetical protein
LSSRRTQFASTLALTVLLVTSCGSTSQTNGGSPVPTACPSVTACLNTANMDGFHQHVLTPAGNAASVGKSWYYPPLGHLGWGFLFPLRDAKSGQTFVETIGTHPEKYPCRPNPLAPNTEPRTTPGGRQICVTVDRSQISARMVSSGVLYQIHLSVDARLDASAWMARLLGIIDQLR